MSQCGLADHYLSSSSAFEVIIAVITQGEQYGCMVPMK
jgi:hypothetical protein